MRFEAFVELDKRFEGCKKTSRLAGAE
ncbi:hypothetical protein SIAM614_21145 [Stappia aggregata IAM 12614]|uniref:Uncharacterized protein n=1 Tax=Roseibium aggregatum (strain ATCC 25650 / DSM 13394 / JCM 20685 / NBRC 16684 / NCIMB 2208 / IAM 12614 / B1) TaxID=384765 RepID=A0NYP0_ROSAI|nr:hypothetical protein SIAM614_21145 [Stappia aggregata IAM 12614] [Roseibium aggregatum IAM 12614]